MSTKFKFTLGILLVTLFLTQQVAFAGPASPPTPAGDPTDEAEVAEEPEVVEEKPEEKWFFPDIGAQDISFGRCGVYFPYRIPLGYRVLISKGHITSRQQNHSYDILRAIKIEVFHDNGEPARYSHTITAQVYCNLDPGEATFQNTASPEKRFDFYKDGSHQNTWYTESVSVYETKQRMATNFTGSGTYILGRPK